MNAWNEVGEGKNHLNSAESEDLNFEDNFLNSEEKGSNTETSEQFKLPDSAEYLSKLESRLNKIKNQPDVLKQLAERREACMNNLLNSSYNNLSDREEDLNQPIHHNILEPASELIRHIRPEQAQTVGEIVHIIEHDQLEEDHIAESNSDNSSLADR